MEETRADIRCGIVGLGRIGSLLEKDRLREKPCTHAGAVARNGDCTLVGGCDIRKDRRDLFAAQWGCPRVYGRVGDLLRDRNPHLLIIATPPETHLSIIRESQGYGVRVIVCEKPLARDCDEGAEIARIDASGDVTIMTNHERRYSKDYIMVKRRIEDGSFGELLSVCSRLYTRSEGKDADGSGETGGVLLEDGTHLVDMINFLTPAVLQKKHVRKSGDRAVFIEGDGGVPVMIEIGTGRDYFVFELDLSFTRGRIRIGNGLFEEFESGASPYYEGYNSLLRNGRRRPVKTGYFSGMLEDAVRCVRDPRAVPVSSAADGYRALRFIDEVRRDLSVC